MGLGLGLGWSHWKKPAPKKSGCSSPTRSPWLGAPPRQMPSSSSAATPVAASAAANLGLGAGLGFGVRA